MFVNAYFICLFLLVLIFVYIFCIYFVLILIPIIVLKALQISLFSLIPDDQKAGWSSQGDRTLGVLCQQCDGAGPDQRPDSPRLTWSGPDGVGHHQVLQRGVRSSPSAPLCGLWLLQGDGRGEQVEDQVQRLARPRHLARHLALPLAACSRMHDRFHWHLNHFIPGEF